MSDKLKQRSVMAVCLVALAFFLRMSVGNIGQILRGEVRISRRLNSEWITIGDFYTQDTSPLGYVATQWGFLIILAVFAAWYLFEVKKRMGVVSTMGAAILLVVSAGSGLVGF